MASPITTPETAAKIDNLLREGLSNNAIADKLKVGYMTVTRRRAMGDFPKTSRLIPVLNEAQIAPAIRRVLIKKGVMSHQEIAELIGLKPARVKAEIKEMKARGALIIETVDGRYDLSSPSVSEAGRLKIRGNTGDWTHVIGLVNDNHMCNKHARLDVLNAAYDHFANAGISIVLNGGNWIDGEFRFNKGELVTAPGMDNQLDYMIDNYPERKGITTHYIAGDDHEGWYAQREGIEIGKYLQFRAQDQGRNDLKYLGYAEADIQLQFGKSSAVARLVHPGGGSSYAISYTDQKRVESYQGGEKPSIEFASHYHKFNYGYPREVHTMQTGCTEDQTLFMRKKKLQAHVGFCVAKIKQDSQDGHITRFAPEFFPFFDRKFYEKRY